MNVHQVHKPKIEIHLFIWGFVVIKAAFDSFLENVAKSSFTETITNEFLFSKKQKNKLFEFGFEHLKIRLRQITC